MILWSRDPGSAKLKGLTRKDKILKCDHSNGRLRVVSNFGDGDCGAGEIHTRARARNFEATI